MLPVLYIYWHTVAVLVKFGNNRFIICKLSILMINELSILRCYIHASTFKINLNSK